MIACELQPAPRRPDWPLWAVAVVAAWATLLAVSVALSVARGRAVELCTFKHVTGVPCPACGMTRGVLAGLRGRPVDMWLHNPLMFTVLGLWAGSTRLRVGLARRVRVRLTGRTRTAAWALGGGALAANWAYVIRCIG